MSERSGLSHGTSVVVPSCLHAAVPSRLVWPRGRCRSLLPSVLIVNLVPAASLCFYRCFLILQQPSPPPRLALMTAIRPPCSSLRVRPRTASRLPPCHPALRQLCRQGDTVSSASRAPTRPQLLSCDAHPTCLRCYRMAGCGCAKELCCWKPGRRLANRKIESGL